MEPKFKVDPLYFQDHISACKSNLESDPNENLTASRDTFQPLLSMYHDSLFHDPLNQPTLTFKDVQPLVSSSDHIPGSRISQV